MKLSIIIPVYNVEAFIDRCLNSILIQTECEFEIEVIIVNDGSSDMSLFIAESFAKKYSNVFVYSHSNAGLSYTRNVGLSYSTGDYIWFIDSDDYIKNGIFNILSFILKGEYDIIALTTEIEKNEVRKVISRKKLNTGIYSSVEIYNRGYVYPYSGVQFYIFKKTFLVENHLTFKEGIYFEDSLFTPIALYLASSCYYLKNAAYVYTIRDGSIINSKVTLKKCDDVLIVSDELYSFLRFRLGSLSRKRIIYQSIASIYGVFYQNFYLKLDIEDRDKALKLFKLRKYWVKSVFCSFNLKYLYKMFIVFFKLYLKI